MFDWFSDNLLELFGYVNDANKRIYWGYLLSALILSLWVFKRTSSTHGQQNFLTFLFPRRVWLAASAQQDYLIFIINKLVKSLLFAPLLFTIVPVALGVSGALEAAIGSATPENGWLPVPQAGVIAAFTVLLFLIDDFSRFLLHWLLHKVPFLWEFHKVHHSATVLTPMTIYRSHPVESYLYAIRMTSTQGVVVGICFVLFGSRLSMFDIVGANVFVFAFNILGSNLRHSHIWLSWGDRVESWLISPAQHQLHHSVEPKHFDRNLGSALAIWDSWFGTLVKASSVKSPPAVGFSNEPLPSFAALYFQPFVLSFRSIAQTFRILLNAIHSVWCKLRRKC